MKVTARSEKEIAEANLWPAGEYGFEILDATEEVSKSGNEMLKLKVAVYSASGGQRIVFDYLMDIESMAYKLRHASDACGILDKYESGSIVAEDFKGKSGWLKLRIQKDKTGDYPDKNVIADYVPGKRADAAPPTASKNGAAKPEALEDSIPF